ncbi:glycosyltransferase family 9 protein [Flavobacteriaceae bacterium TP-CH-4]|uniref:Glycosyltransferase family 9 protein n=2 Tax=Pelagihabitans pacificus TaxID=2696054 RepID=A0A967AWN8_9FLAO|nr:glycosyltransferase family 9 protein [Pelagihabitans pacificus]
MKFLVIQQKMIGDVLTSTIICENLRHLYPDGEIHFIANESTLPVLQNNPDIDKIITFKNEHRTNKRALYRFLKKIKKERYDAVIDAYGKLESNLMTYFSGAKYKISHHKWYTQWLYTDTVEENLHPNKSLPLAVENRLQLLNPLLGHKNQFQTRPKIYLSQSEVDSASTKIDRVRTYRGQKIVMISILGSSNLKTYPAEYMAKVIDTIADNTRVRLLFNYIPSQEKEARTIFDKCKPTTREKVAFDFYAPSLRDFIVLLSQCNALIGNEGGAVNMAKALNVPTFCIFSPFIIKGAWHNETGKEHHGEHLKDYRPELFTGLNKKDIKENIATLYQAFEPDLFKINLVDFLDTYCKE